ncbi:hypothetical protein DC366_18305 [Pelagivirga sediminicola]|uniref:Uncharacterized protein n=1 Tax=Pelagivirga sediminicola TaxID=2170575 RepID=A0A2T7G2G6_9RHOB|nr:hypothetical protein DC366_18305 [Pelagivirga sediminicola]
MADDDGRLGHLAILLIAATAIRIINVAIVYFRMYAGRRLSRVLAMRFEFKNLPLAAFLALALTGPTVPTQARAQTYQIDCAILLCLSGGWPASVPCARARAEF